MTGTDRRHFLKTTAVGTISATAVSALSTRKVRGANDRVRLGLIGCGGRGTGLAQQFASIQNVELAYACDPDQERSATTAKSLGTAKPVQDLRRVIDDQTVDAVLVATPDHWHTPAALLALEAGKHVYVEKPCSHNLREGRLLVEAARRTGCQVTAWHPKPFRSPDPTGDAVIGRRCVIGQVLVAKALERTKAQRDRPQPAVVPAGDSRLRSLGGAGAQDPIPGQLLSLRLALVVQLRYRGYG